ncbi:TRAP transporter, DctM subunit [Evansella caseinilytica]|uniref:TRAP transporter, DctM subunit n=1 Tax=Evansella caseinilytica TaxID=1503961 RepID=A0A1H3SXL4_9BACI|nr:TRAP transporter large permease [Evansella caseinilytica]SDZ42520.1 TRAP transporter, DctM subunit [Evansella caseinilytica]
MLGTIVLFASFLVLLLLGFPVALVLSGSALITMLVLDISLATVVPNLVQGVNSYTLLAVPFFILAGQLMSEGGLALRLINMANLLVGMIRGGLAMVNCFTSLLFGNISGSAVADVSSVGSVMIPMMKKKGYDKDYTVAVTAASSIQGVIMPPSHNMILYALAAGGVSISSLFLAGIVPAVILLIGLMTTSYIIAGKRGYEKGEPVPLRQVPKILLDGILSMMTGVIILGGIFSGKFTATESGAIACLYAFILVFFVYREIPLSQFGVILKKTFRTISMVLFLIAASKAFAFILTYLQIPGMMTDFLLTLSDNRVVIILIITVLLLLLGAPLDMAPLILIMTPILYPVVVGTLGMDPVHFGIIMILNLGIGLITPPVGTVLFTGCAIGKVSIEKGAKALIPFYLVMVAILLLLTFVPGIVMWLPDTFG